MQSNAFIESSFLPCRSRPLTLLSALLCCLSSASVSANATTGSTAAPPVLSHDDAENALSQALSLPPVFAADLLLRIASGVPFRLPADQARFVSTAVDLAAQVPFQTKLRALLFLPVDSEAGLKPTPPSTASIGSP